MGLFATVWGIVSTILYWTLVKPAALISVTRYRFLIIVPFVLPMSLVYYWFTYLRSRIFFALSSGPKSHDKKVQTVVDGIRANNALPNPLKMCTARPSWENMSIFRAKYKSSSHQVDLSKFIDILEINEKKGTIRVEPLVNVGQLTSALVPLGWTLEVLPELDDLTIGGLISGFGIESSSHKYGLIQHILASLDVVLPDGTIVHCSPTEHPDLFYNLPWAHGTLGFLVAAELKIVRASPYVKIKYEPFTNETAFMKAITEATKKGTKLEFIEALQYSRNEFVLMTGNFADKVGTDGVYFDHGAWHAPWFYEHVAGFLKSGTSVEYVPLRAYYHRHTRSIFWEAHDFLPFGNNIIFRYLLGWMLPLKVGFLKLTTPADLHKVYVKKHVDQDMLIPLATLPKVLDLVHKEFQMYPLWLCPCRIPESPVRGLVNAYDSNDDMYIDLGVYGTPFFARPEGGEKFEPAPAMRRFEKLVRELHGFQALYAVTYMTQEEFDAMFDHGQWKKLREKYKCDKFLPTIYDKVSLKARGETEELALRDALVKKGQ